eukprot:m51a1_g7472 putative serine-threonine protein (958) ;mRNA; r:178397-182922
MRPAATALAVLALASAASSAVDANPASRVCTALDAQAAVLGAGVVYDVPRDHVIEAKASTGALEVAQLFTVPTVPFLVTSVKASMDLPWDSAQITWARIFAETSGQWIVWDRHVFVSVIVNGTGMQGLLVNTPGVTSPRPSFYRAEGSQWTELTNLTDAVFIRITGKSANALRSTLEIKNPPGWKCRREAYQDGKTCDCNCMGWDSDCENKSLLSTCDLKWAGSVCTPANYASGDGCQCCPGAKDLDCLFTRDPPKCPSGLPGKCTSSGTCKTTWTCPEEKYTDKACDCGCGGHDPACSLSTPVSTCSASSDTLCKYNGDCWVPTSWTCGYALYDERSVTKAASTCNCKCGAEDPGCAANMTCLSDGSGCVAPLCGNNVAEQALNEQCDGGLGCSGCACTDGYEPLSPVFKDCHPKCGDGRVVKGEECDGGYACTEQCTCPKNHRAMSPPSIDCSGKPRPVNTAAIVGGVVGGVGGAIVLMAVIALIVFIKTRRTVAAAAERHLELENAPLASSGRFAPLTTPVGPKFQKEGCQLVAAGAADWSIGVERFDFSLGGQQATVGDLYTQEFQITNRLDTRVTYTFYPPLSNKYTVIFTPYSDTVKSNQVATVKATIQLHCTTKVEDPVPVQVTYEGKDGAARKEYMTIPIFVEGGLSTRIDFDELQIQQPAVGEGSYGIVYRGKWRGNDVAIKQLKDALVGQDETAKADFLREVRNMEGLRSPYIVNFYGAVIVPGKMCLVTEFCEMGSLGHVLRTHNLQPTLRVRFMIDCVKGMNFLHLSNIIHRDLKPDNLLVVSLAEEAPVLCKLTDFGTSRGATAGIKEAGMTKGLGTPIYMAPEVLNAGQYTNAADVYSFSIMLWELWKDEVPYSTANFVHAWDIANFVTRGDRLEPPSDAPAKYNQLMVDCWAQEFGRRPTFTEVLPRLEEILREVHEAAGSNSRQPSSATLKADAAGEELQV